MAKICDSFSVPVVVIVCIFFPSLVSAVNEIYGEATVTPYRDGQSKNQLNIYEGDQFIVDFVIQGWYHKQEYAKQFENATLVKVTQGVSGVSEYANIVLTRVESSLYTVTSVSPVTSKFDRSATVISSSNFYPRKYWTEFSVQNSTNETIPLQHVRQVKITSHTLATNPGISVQIDPCH